MLRETGVIAVTGIKRIWFLAIAIAAVLAALCLLGILIWQIVGLFPALSYLSDVSAVPVEGWLSVAVKSTIAVVCYFLGTYLFEKGSSWGRSAIAPLERDFRRSAEIISGVQSNVSSAASGIWGSAGEAVGSAHEKHEAPPIAQQTIGPDREVVFPTVTCPECGNEMRVSSAHFRRDISCIACLHQFSVGP